LGVGYGDDILSSKNPVILNPQQKESHGPKTKHTPQDKERNFKSYAYFGLDKIILIN
jgi:hypothetical protein